MLRMCSLLSWIFNDDNDGCWVEMESRCNSVCSNRDSHRVDVLGLVIWSADGLTLTYGEILQSAGRLLQCLILLSCAREKKSLIHTDDFRSLSYFNDIISILFQQRQKRNWKAFYNSFIHGTIFLLVSTLAFDLIWFISVKIFFEK